MCQPTTYPKTVELVQHVAQSPPVEVYNNLFCPQCVQRHLTAFAVGVSDFDFILMFGRANVHKGPARAGVVKKEAPGLRESGQQGTSSRNFNDF